jgi:hypothetical protein
MPTSDPVDLKQVEARSIEDCWVGAGLIRNAIWNHLDGRSVELEECADIPWSVRNQARMHERNGDAPDRNKGSGCNVEYPGFRRTRDQQLLRGRASEPSGAVLVGQCIIVRRRTGLYPWVKPEGMLRRDMR